MKAFLYYISHVKFNVLYNAELMNSDISYMMNLVSQRAFWMIVLIIQFEVDIWIIYRGTISVYHTQHWSKHFEHISIYKCEMLKICFEIFWLGKLNLIQNGVSIILNNSYTGLNRNSRINHNLFIKTSGLSTELFVF